MNLSDDLYACAPYLDVELRPKGVYLKYAGERLRGDNNTLRILDVFSRPIRMQDAVTALQHWTPGSAAFTKMMAEVMSLVSCGVIVNQTGQLPVLESHPAHSHSLSVHVRMLNDRARTQAYQVAIQQTVTSSDIVLDIGTGTGILAASAAAAGARHVYAIERTKIARLAQKFFEANALSDRITLIETESGQVELPEKADVLVSELLGNDPLAERIRGTTIDAVKRLLKPDAQLLPERVHLYGLPLSVAPQWTQGTKLTPAMVKQWQSWYGFDFSPLLEATVGQDHYARISTQAARTRPRLSKPIRLVEVDLRTAREEDIEVSHRARARRDGQLTGILVYFEILFGRNNYFTIAPDMASPSNHWASTVWLPADPVDLIAGESFEITFRFRDGRSSFDVKKLQE
jgi:predicted RNA methylase